MSLIERSMATIRSFFAVDIDSKEIIKRITRVQDDLDIPIARIAFVAPENFHFTLKFLGEIDPAIVPELQKKAEQIDFQEFTLELEGLGCLPNFSYINAIFII